MRTLLAVAAIALLTPGVASAQFFGDVLGPNQNNMNALMLPSRMARDQAELERVQQENQMRQMDLEDRRARRAMNCRLPDGRLVECR